MKHAIFALCVLFAGFATTARAQGEIKALAPAPAPGSFSIKCNPNLVINQYTATQSIWTYTCSTDAAINGVAFKGLTFSETGDGNDSGKNTWGVIVGTLANGNEVYFQFHGTARKTSTVTSAGTLSYTIVAGSGTASGISGSGTCNGTGAQGKGSEWTCAGSYTVR